jgi:hypothetical protein
MAADRRETDFDGSDERRQMLQFRSDSRQVPGGLLSRVGHVLHDQLGLPPGRRRPILGQWHVLADYSVVGERPSVCSLCTAASCLLERLCALRVACENVDQAGLPAAPLLLPKMSFPISSSSELPSR